VALLRATWMWEWLGGQTNDLIETAERIQLDAPPADPNAQGWLSGVQGYALFSSGDVPAAATQLAEAQALFDETNDMLGMSEVKIIQGILAGLLEGEAPAQERLGQLLVELEERGDRGESGRRSTPWPVCARSSTTTRARTISSRGHSKSRRPWETTS